jgi:hypothetical protein
MKPMKAAALTAPTGVETFASQSWSAAVFS